MWFDTMIYIFGWISFVILILIILFIAYSFIKEKIRDSRLEKETEKKIEENRENVEVIEKEKGGEIENVEETIEKEEKN